MFAKTCRNKKLFGCVSRKEIWIMDPAADQYYRWLTVIAAPVFYNLMMIVTRYALLRTCETAVRVMSTALKHMNAAFQGLF